MAEELAVVGQSVTRYDAAEKVTGKAKYSSDMYLPGWLCGKILRSPHGYAKILSIDTSKAKALPGVEAVITVDDAPQKVVWSPNRLIFAKDYVRHYGEPVAAVAAVTEEIAEQALDLIEVEYDPLTPALTREDALKVGAPEILPGGNEAEFKVSQFIDLPNDVEEGFKEADVILEDDYTVQHAGFAAKASACATSYWNTHGKLFQWISAQGCDGQEATLTNFFGLSDTNKVEVDATYSYGSYGPNQPGKDETYISPLLAKVTGKPVMIQLSQEETWHGHHTNPDSTEHLKMGFKNNGLITAIHTKGLGAAGSSGGAFAIGVAHERSPMYLHYYPVAKSESSTVATNTCRRGNYIGLSCLNCHFAIEQMMDQAAEKLGINPVDFHLLNKIKSGDRIKASRSGPPDPVLSCVDMESCINGAADALDFKNRWKGHGQPVAIDGPRQRGIAVSDFVHNCIAGSCGAAVKVTPKGAVDLYCNVPDPGTGCKTIMCQFAAEALGVNYEDINLSPDNTRFPPGGRCYTSRATLSLGWPVTLAAQAAKQEVLKVAAGILKVTPDELDCKNREIYLKADPTQKIPFEQACAKFKSDMFGTCAYATNERPNAPRNFGTHCDELEVDVETGGVTVKKIAVTNDCGRAVNPLQLKNNMGGAQVKGIGYALMEEVIYDRASGVCLNTRAVDYKFPTSMDMPFEDYHMILVEPVDPVAPYGAHGATEGIMDPMVANFANAIYNACGVRIKNAPMTPDKILKGLGKI